MSFPKLTAQGNSTSAPSWKAVIGWRSSRHGIEQSLFCFLSFIPVASFGIAGWGDFELLIYKANISSGKNHLGSKCQSNFCWKRVSPGEVPACTLKTSRLWGPGSKDSGFPQACARVHTPSKHVFLDVLRQCALLKQQLSFAGLSPSFCAHRYPLTVVTMLGMFVCTGFLNVWPGYKVTPIIQTEGWSSISRNQAGKKGSCQRRKSVKHQEFPFEDTWDRVSNGREYLSFPTQ